MSDFELKKGAVAFSLLVFCFLSLGSWLFGARLITSVIRGLEGVSLFGLVAWIVGKRLQTLGTVDSNEEAEDVSGNG